MKMPAMKKLVASFLYATRQALTTNIPPRVLKNSNNNRPEKKSRLGLGLGVRIQGLGVRG